MKEKGESISCYVSRIIIAVLIVFCLVYSKCNLDAMKTCEPLVSKTTTHIIECDQNKAPPSTNENKETDETTADNMKSNYVRKPPRPPRHNEFVQKKTNIYPIFCMAYFVVLAGTLAALIVLFIKDDSWFRCAKLNELRKIREKFFAGEVNDSANKTETEDKSTQKTTNMGKDSNTNTKITETTKTNKTTEITDQRAALLRHYMDCVAEL